MRWCWHSWTKWTDYSLEPKEETGYDVSSGIVMPYSKGERVLQIRRCAKCNKLRVRKIWIES